MKKAPVKLRSRLDSMYRPQSEYLRQSGGDKFFLGASFALAALLAIGVLACVLFTALRDRAALLPAAAVNGSDWKVLYGLPPGACGAGAAAAGPACPLTGARPALWASTQTLAGAHPAGAPPAEHDAAAWLGFRLEARSFAAAAKARANIVALGPLRGNCRVWLDKNFAYEGGCPEAGETASLQLPLARLSVAAPLTVAVELLPVAPRGPAGLFRGAPAGLITQDQAAGLRRFSQLWTLARPLALAGMNLALAAMLFLIWLPAPERREYLFLALLAAFHALNQLTQLNLVYLNVPAATLQAAGFAVAMILAFLPAFAGFAFARMGAWTYRRGLPALLLACAGGFLLIRTPQARAAASGAVLLWGTWTAALAGALACLGQAYALRGRPGSPRARMRRLLAYSAALALLGLTVIFEPGGGLQHLPRFFFERTLHIPLIIFLTYLSLEELRETKRLAANSPVSSYHRRQELPAAVDGCVLMLDFKHSEKLFRLGTRLGIGGELVAKALTEAWEAVSSAGGEVIQTEGDALTALLERRPAEADAGLAARAVGAVAGVRAALDGLAVSYRARGLLGPKESIEFRAACSLGRLRPAWREIGATRQPFWLESGGTNALVDTARLMELERKAPGDADASRFVSPASIPGLGEERLLGSKHGVRHHVRVLLIPSRI